MKTGRICVIFALLLALLLAGCAGGGASSGQKEAQAILEGESLRIPLKEIGETASFYPVEVDGTAMEVLAVKASDGSIRTAFNTCEVCFDSGRGYYKQEGGDLVCQNCGNRFSMDQIEQQSRGCNPWPILAGDKTATEEEILIPYEFLADSKRVFENWKSRS
ncbi:MAG: DUF2318 domain-containing protein [Christensenellaceae bacterium]|jgi:uncharacterized membrane protein|nr:DUF2318 domain-containing protein [Christensenellaceae bacterium]